MDKVTIIIPAYNEAKNLDRLLPELQSTLKDPNILVVDDGSTDDTQKICQVHRVSCVRHPYNMGNGAAVKTGARHAKGEIFVYMDADGQHQPKDIPQLLALLDEGHDQVVGARRTHSHANLWRRFANGFYNAFASWMTGTKIQDLTSGFRAVRAHRFKEFLHLLPNGFSYPTTITMSFFRSGYPLAYYPIEALKREGKSHINIFRDGFRFILIILRVGTLFSPMKLFLPISFALFSTGALYYLYTFITAHRFSNMSAILFLAALFVFLISLVSEQISMLLYAKKE